MVMLTQTHYIPTSLANNHPLGHILLNHLGILLVKGIGAGLARVLLEVDLAHNLDGARPAEWDAVVVGHELVGGTLLVLVALELLAVLVDLLVPAEDE